MKTQAIPAKRPAHRSAYASPACEQPSLETYVLYVDGKMEGSFTAKSYLQAKHKATLRHPGKSVEVVQVW